jgi:hypothetical protein
LRIASPLSLRKSAKQNFFAATHTALVAR